MTLKRSNRASPAVLICMWLVVAAPWLLMLSGQGYPHGIPGDTGFFSGLLPLAVGVVVLGVAGVAALVLGIRNWLRGGRLLPGWRWIVLAVVAMIAGTVLFEMDALFRLRFASARPAFERAVSADGFDASPRRIGGYTVLDAARDPRGGVYFRTGTSPDMIDTYSYGFAYEPNTDGSPYGAARYQLRSLGGGWYVFTANNDWH